jgi:hypothetical protein
MANITRDQVIEAMAKTIAPKHWGNNRGGGLWRDEIWDEQKEIFLKFGPISGFFTAECYAFAEAAFTAIEALGLKLVPSQPTEEMHNAARHWSYKIYGKPIGTDASNGCYAAMLSSSPLYKEPSNDA